MGETVAKRVLVVDDSAMVRRYGDHAVSVRLLNSTERLPAVKRNQALRAARGDLVIFINDDVWNLPAHGPFDAAFCCGLLYHLDRPAEFIRLMSRCVRDVIILHTLSCLPGSQAEAIGIFQATLGQAQIRQSSKIDHHHTWSIIQGSG